MAKFNPVIRKARFSVTGYTPQEMIEIGNRTIKEAIIPRIQSGLDIYDSPAPALKPRYERQKSIKHPPAIRNLTYTGRTLRSMQVLEASHNKCIIGFTDNVSNFRVAINQQRSRQFGTSEKDKAKLLNIVNNVGNPVKVQRTA